MIPTNKLERLLDRFHAVEAELSSGIAGSTFVKLSKEHAELAPVIAAVEAYRSAQQQFAEADALVNDPSTDSEMRIAGRTRARGSEGTRSKSSSAI